MAFQISPGVLVTENDYTLTVPAVSTSIGATVGTFAWGPVLDPVTVTSETNLVSLFGKPNNGNFTSFFTAANFLAYSNNLLLIRADTTNARNAVSTQSGSVTGFTVSVGGTGYVTATVTIGAPNIAGGTQATATATILSGAITALTITEPGSGYTSAPTVTITSGTGTGAVVVSQISTHGVKINNNTDYLTNFSNGAGVYGEFAAKYPGSLGNSLKVSMADSASYAAWAYKNEFNAAPSSSDFVTNLGGSNDELHVIVIDEDGAWTGTRGAILEKYAFVSKAVDAKSPGGTTNYYKNVINSNSAYIRWMDHPTTGTNWGTAAATTTYASISTAVTSSLSGGVDDYAVTDGQLQEGFLLLANAEQYDVSLIAVGKANATVAAYVVNNVAEVRKDCVVFISPQDVTTGEIVTTQGSAGSDALIAYRNALPSSSYMFLDSGYKYQYDGYNDVYRWVPLNGDIAGLTARTDYTNDAWWSPAGYNRGQVKNVTKLAYNPSKVDRDALYKSNVNPVVSFPGDGVVLYGDKTGLTKPSAFDRINVRRLFITLEKAIARMAKYQLFEFNDPFTQAQFRNAVEPFLRTVQGRRGITDFYVKCDSTNNTGDVIDRNEFVGDIYIKPNRAINFITLNFNAVGTDVSFTEIGA